MYIYLKELCAEDACTSTIQTNNENSPEPYKYPFVFVGIYPTVHGTISRDKSDFLQELKVTFSCCQE